MLLSYKIFKSYVKQKGYGVMRKDNLEFRWSEEKNKYELIHWFFKRDEEEFCIVIALYEPKSEGYEIRFIGKRPFEVEDHDLLWKMLKYGQKVADAEFNFYDE